MAHIAAVVHFAPMREAVVKLTGPEWAGLFKSGPPHWRGLSLENLTIIDLPIGVWSAKCARPVSITKGNQQVIISHTCTLTDAIL